LDDSCPHWILIGLNENAALVASLKEKLNIQAAELESLRSKLEAATKANEEQVREVQLDGDVVLMRLVQKDVLQDRISQLSNELAEAQEKRKEAEKEQEDLLVYLDELGTKRKKDKARLRELGDEVSEDEGDADGDDGEEEG
jgi:intracellular protein transport protein USO1